MIAEYAYVWDGRVHTGGQYVDPAKAMSWALALLQFEGTIRFHCLPDFAGILKREGGITRWL